MDFSINQKTRDALVHPLGSQEGPWFVVDFCKNWYVVNMETQKGKKIGPCQSRRVCYVQRAVEEATARNEKISSSQREKRGE